MTAFEQFVQSVENCRICEAHLPLGPRPVIRVAPDSRILVIGQAPGTKVHASGIPWDDASGKRLRAWLGVAGEDFYDASQFAIVPMGFCFPGTGKSGDLPPRPECAPQWHTPLLEAMPDISADTVDWYLCTKILSAETHVAYPYVDRPKPAGISSAIFSPSTPFPSQSTLAKEKPLV